MRHQKYQQIIQDLQRKAKLQEQEIQRQKVAFDNDKKMLIQDSKREVELLQNELR